MSYADLQATSVDTYAATRNYHLALGLEPPPPPHPTKSVADEFGRIDAEIRRLKVRRDELRETIIARGNAELVGQEWSVIVEARSARWLDQQKLADRFGAAAVNECRTVRTNVYLRAERIS